MNMYSASGYKGNATHPPKKSTLRTERVSPQDQAGSKHLITNAFKALGKILSKRDRLSFSPNPSPNSAKEIEEDKAVLIRMFQAGLQALYEIYLWDDELINQAHKGSLKCDKLVIDEEYCSEARARFMLITEDIRNDITAMENIYAKLVMERDESE